MKNGLVVCTSLLYNHKDGRRVSGPNPDMYGDFSGLKGYCTGLKGYCTGLSGDCTWLTGYCTGLKGDCTGLTGDLSTCEITDADRCQGIDIKSLIG